MQLLHVQALSPDTYVRKSTTDSLELVFKVRKNTGNLGQLLRLEEQGRIDVSHRGIVGLCDVPRCDLCVSISVYTT